MPRKKSRKGYEANGNMSPLAKEYLEQVQCSKDSGCTPRMMKQAFFALEGGDWEEHKCIFKVKAKATEWAV